MNRRNPLSGSARPRSLDEAAAAWVARRDAGMSDAEQREFERWRNADPRHEAALAYFDSAWSALGAPARSGAATELEAELAVLAGRRRRRRVTAAASAALLLIAAVFAWRGGVPAHEPTSTAVAVVVHPKTMTLPDGSVVELNEGAEVSVEYGASARHVTLHRGEAHFAVQKHHARPFVVSANGIDVRAVGTAFDVKIAPKAVAVLVTEGRVSVENTEPAPVAGNEVAVPPPERGKPALAVLNAGDHAIIDVAGEPHVEKSRADALVRRLSWREAHVEFTRAPLSEAVALLNDNAPSAAPRLVIGDPALAQVRVTGVFRPSNIEGFVSLLERGFGVAAERNGNVVTLRLAR